MRKLLLAVTVALLPLAADAQSIGADDEAAAPPPSLAADPGYATRFQCPESYPDDTSRRSATQDFLGWATRAHPDWRVDDTLNYRTSLLKQHHCDVSLDSEVANLPQTER